MNKPNIKNLFDNISKDYDKLNYIISFGLHSYVKKTAIQKANIDPSAKVLDICTGTGDIAIHIAKNISKSGAVTGVDFSEKMLEIAKKKANGIKDIDFRVADALHLPFEDETFDVCFISFGLRNLTDLEKGICEMARVCKKEGLIIILDTGKPKGIFSIFFKIYFFYIVPILGRLFHGEITPYKYLPQSTIDFPNSEQMRNKLEDLGLIDIKSYDYLFGTISQQIATKNV